jgi:RNA polymerase sigma-70 factor, ECF subfamily
VDLVMALPMRAIAGGAEIPDSDMADQRAIERCLGGDRESFAIPVRRHGPAVFAFCARIVGPSIGEELAQETFARAWSRLGEFRWESSFRCWLFRIALNLCRDHLKSGSAREDATASLEGSLEPLDRAAGPEARALGTESMLALRRAVDRLPTMYREVFLLKHVENLSYREIGDIVRISIPALKVRVHRAREMLRNMLEEAKDTP